MAGPDETDTNDTKCEQEERAKMDAIAQKQRERESEIESRQRESGVSSIDLCRNNVPAFSQGCVD